LCSNEIAKERKFVKKRISTMKKLKIEIEGKQMMQKAKNK
jgi:hypothetical protein